MRTTLPLALPISIPTTVAQGATNTRPNAPAASPPSPEENAARFRNFTNPPRVEEARSGGSSNARYWPSGTVDVDIDGHDFDFKPDRRGAKKGEVDGPLNHNGRYEVLEDGPGKLKLKMHAGTDDAQKNDLDATMTIHNGKAKVSGTASGKELNGDLELPVGGSGTKRDPYRIEFTDKAGKTHTVTWAPD